MNKSGLDSSYNEKDALLSEEEQEEARNLGEAEFSGKGWTAENAKRLAELNAKRNRIREERKN